MVDGCGLVADLLGENKVLEDRSPYLQGQLGVEV